MPELPPLKGTAPMTRRSLMLLLPIIIVPMLLAAGGPCAASTDDLSLLSRPPQDSAEAEAVRIWLPVERSNHCRVTIEIHDRKGDLVRSLLDQLLGPGYYNFYWDKKDDSGRYVTPGRYRYRVNNCGKHDGGILTARYHPDERRLIVHDNHRDSSGTVCYEILDDTVFASMVVYSLRGHVMDTLFVDSLLTRGEREVRWQPSRRVSPGLYRLEITAGAFVHRADLRLAQ